MSLEQVKAVVERFISDAYNDLLIIKGGWGVGKTYFWQHLVQDVSQKKVISKRYYSYVSLFGISDLEELKNAILVASVDATAVQADDRNKGLLASSKQLLKGVEKIPVLREWTGGLAGAALFLSVRDSLICFDDIERKGDGLDTKDLLGLASLLKEQRSCKIAFIMNDGSLPRDEFEEFKRHSEKIIDLELQFSPSSEETFNYVFEVAHGYYDLILSSCLTLSIKNIRTLQRIRRFIERLLPRMDRSEPVVVENVLRSVVLFVWCYFDKDSDVPPLDYVMSHHHYGLLFSTKEESETEKRWNSLLRSYGYRGTDALDRHLAAFIERGYLDDAAFTIELDKKNEEARAQQGRDTYGRVWTLWRDSFDDNELEFIQALEVSFRPNMKHLSLHDLQSAVELLRDLEQDQLANDLVDDYFSQHFSRPVMLNLEHIPFMHSLKDHYIIERLNYVRDTTQDTRTLADVVKKLATSNGWDSSDTDIMASCDVEDYYHFFKSENSDCLYFYVKTCLRFGEFVNANEQYKLIAEKARGALRRIASESRINRLRVAGLYGIDVG